MEVVVVYNGSTDATADVARAARARVAEEPTLRVCAARQLRTHLAPRQVVVSTDADTVHPPYSLTLIYAAFQAYPDLVAVSVPCLYEYPPRCAAFLPPLLFLFVAVSHSLTSLVSYFTSTNFSFLI